MDSYVFRNLDQRLICSREVRATSIIAALVVAGYGISRRSAPVLVLGIVGVALAGMLNVDAPPLIAAADSELVDEASDASFPASDPPSFTSATLP